MLRGLRIARNALVVVALGAAAVALAVRTARIPPELYSSTPETPMVCDMHGMPVAEPGSLAARDANPIPLREMGEWIPLATVAVEDHRFWTHCGVDFHATFGALMRNLRNRRIVSGGSTITQQLVKLAAQRPRRTFSEKAVEALAALRLESEWEKARILEAYLNRLDYGNRRIGPEAAAQAYFGKSASRVTLPEAIYLAGLPQSPTRLNPWRHPGRAEDRYRRNAMRLAALGLLPPGIGGESLSSACPKIEMHFPQVLARHFSEMALARSSGRGGPVLTTLDLEIQRAAENLLSEHLRSTGPRGAGDAAIVVVDNATGEVRALASGGSSIHRSINAAATPRSCGSTLKPFIYLGCIERRILTAASLLPDTEQAACDEYRDYDPQNYSRRFYGPVRMREALGNSMNVPAVVALSRLEARNAFNELRRWGFDFPRGFDAYGAGFILGNAEIRLVDLAAAYAGIARGGIAWKAKILRKDAIQSDRIASAEACSIVTDILCDNNARRLSFGLASPLNLGVRIAVKTGTSSGFRDRWCVGFNSGHTVAVWSGNLDGKPMGEVLAVRAAGPLWAAMMRRLLASGDDPVPPPVASNRLRTVAVAAETGLLPRPGEMTVNEWFLAGTEPAESAASSYDVVDGRQTWVLPPEYGQWCRSSQNRLGAIARSSDLRILMPREGAAFIINPNLPARQQVIHFSASQPGCRWLLNGREAPDRFQLAPGQWHLVAEHAGSHAEASFTVE